MKLILFTDIHLDTWQQFSSVNSDGHNTRLINQLDVLEFLLQETERLNGNLIFAGDLWNRRLLIPTQVVHLTYELLSKYTKQAIYLILGNHDLYSWDSKDSPVVVFKPLKHVNIIDRVTDVYFQPLVTVTMVPFGSLLPHSPPIVDGVIDYNILIAHTGCNEAVLGPKNIRMDTDVSLRDLVSLGYNLVLLGHIHKHQELTKDIIVLGSVMAHSFHEVNEEKYYFTFDTDTKKLDKIKSTAPKFIEHTVSSKKELLRVELNDTDYFKIRFESGKLSHDLISRFAKPNILFASSSNIKEKDIVSLPAKILKPEDEVVQYFSKAETELDRQRLIKTASNIINEVDSE